MRVSNKVTLYQENGETLIFENNIEDSDIANFIEIVRTKNELNIFMNEILKENNLIKLFSNHRKYFYLKKFKNRAILVQADEIEKKAIEMIKSHYESKMETEVLPYVEKLTNFYMQVSAFGIKAIAELPQKEIEQIQKASLKDIIKRFKEDDIPLSFDENNRKILEKEMKVFLPENADFYSIASLIPLLVLSLIEDNKKGTIDDNALEKIKKMGVTYPVLTVYVCNMVKYHTYSNPPFIAIFLPHMETPDVIFCPKCGNESKKIKFYSFLPDISKRILKEGGFYPYMIAYLLNKNEISFLCNLYTENTNETDFVITKGDKQIYMEIKCFDKISSQRKDKIATRFLAPIAQINKNIKKWEKEKNVKFNESNLIVNYSSEEIKSAINESDKLDSEIKNNNIKLYGYNQLSELINHIQSEDVNT